MSSFTEQKWYIVAKWNKWATTRNFKFYLDDNMEWEFIEVPSWYETDGASIPKFLCFLWSKVEPDSISSAILHNYLYHTQQYSLWKSDLIFLDALRVEWCNILKRYLLFIWVKLWGWIVWNYKKYFKNKKK